MCPLMLTLHPLTLRQRGLTLRPRRCMINEGQTTRPSFDLYVDPPE